MILFHCYFSDERADCSVEEFCKRKERERGRREDDTWLGLMDPHSDDLPSEPSTSAGPILRLVKHAHVPLDSVVGATSLDTLDIATPAKKMKKQVHCKSCGFRITESQSVSLSWQMEPDAGVKKKPFTCEDCQEIVKYLTEDSTRPSSKPHPDPPSYDLRPRGSRGSENKS